MANVSTSVLHEHESAIIVVTDKAREWKTLENDEKHTEIVQKRQRTSTRE